MGKLSDFRSSPPELLKEGKSLVRLSSYKTIDSFHDYNGQLKINRPEYVTSTEQLVITIVATQYRGALTHRFNMDGYVKYEELTPLEKSSGKFVDRNGYACAVDPESGQLVRLSDERKEETCRSLLNNFFNAVLLPVGSTIDDLDAVIKTRTEFVADVIMDEYNGKTRPKVRSFSKASSVVLQKAGEDDEKEDIDEDLKA